MPISTSRPSNQGCSDGCAIASSTVSAASRFSRAAACSVRSWRTVLKFHARKPANPATSRPPSNREIEPSIASRMKSRVTPISSGYSLRTTCSSTANTATRPHSPRISPRLAILLPTMLPIAIGLPVAERRLAITVTVSSGMLVPKATTVMATTVGGTRHRAARRLAPRTRNSAPPTRKMNPAQKRSKSNRMPVTESTFVDHGAVTAESQRERGEHGGRRNPRHLRYDLRPSPVSLCALCACSASLR